MESKKKIFVGSGKQRKDDWITISLCVTDIPKEFIKESKNGKKYLSLNFNKRREPDNYGNDWSLSINDFVPEKKTDGVPF